MSNIIIPHIPHRKPGTTIRRTIEEKKANLSRDEVIRIRAARAARAKGVFSTPSPSDWASLVYKSIWGEDVSVDDDGSDDVRTSAKAELELRSASSGDKGQCLLYLKACVCCPQASHIHKTQTLV